MNAVTGAQARGIGRAFGQRMFLSSSNTDGFSLEQSSTSAASMADFHLQHFDKVLCDAIHQVTGATIRVRIACSTVNTSMDSFNSNRSKQIRSNQSTNHAVGFENSGHPGCSEAAKRFAGLIAENEPVILLHLTGRIEPPPFKNGSKALRADRNRAPFTAFRRLSAHHDQLPF
jgi:hypothetical protein